MITDITKYIFELFSTCERDGLCFERIKIGEFYISVQAGLSCYSEPQRTYDSLISYTKYEIALFDKNDNWISPQEDKRFNQFSWKTLFENDCKNPVAGFVERSQIEKICEDLLSLSSSSMN